MKDELKREESENLETLGIRGSGDEAILGEKMGFNERKLVKMTLSTC